MSHILLNQSPMDDTWGISSFQNRTEQNRQRSSPNQDCKGKWKWSIQLKEAHSSGWSVLASEPWAQQGFGKVIEGCLTLSGQIRFPSIVIPRRDQGSNSRAEVDFCKIHCHISVIFQAYWIVLDLIFMPPLPFFSCCLESVVVEINPCNSNWIRIRVSSLKFSFFFLKL